MASTAASAALLGTLNRVNADLGLPTMEPQDPLKRGAADISWVAKDVEGGLNGLGAAASGAHAPGEAVDIASIWRQAKRAAILMSRLAVAREIDGPCHPQSAGARFRGDVALLRRAGLRGRVARRGLDDPRSAATLKLEFFPHPELDPLTSWFSCCLRLDDLDGVPCRLRGGGGARAA